MEVSIQDRGVKHGMSGGPAMSIPCWRRDWLSSSFVFLWATMYILNSVGTRTKGGESSQHHLFCQNKSVAPGSSIQFSRFGRSQFSNGSDCSCSGFGSCCCRGCCSSFFGAGSCTWNFLQLIPTKFKRSILSQHLQFS